MKSLLAVLFVATLTSASVLASTGHYNDVTKSSAPSSDKSAAGSKHPNAQEYVDTARTGQAAPVRTIEKDGRCKDGDGVWHHNGDVGYNECVRVAKRVKQ